jgi:hypothetical protein
MYIDLDEMTDACLLACLVVIALCLVLCTLCVSQSGDSFANKSAIGTRKT